MLQRASHATRTRVANFVGIVHEAAELGRVPARSGAPEQRARRAQPEDDDDELDRERVRREWPVLGVYPEDRHVHVESDYVLMPEALEAEEATQAEEEAARSLSRVSPEERASLARAAATFEELLSLADAPPG